jgi:hypothetical protein
LSIFVRRRAERSGRRREITADGQHRVGVVFALHWKEEVCEMRNTARQQIALAFLLCGAVLLQACNRKPPVSATEHVRGTVQSLEGQALTLSTATGSVVVQLDQSTKVATLVQSSRDHITGGSFLGITSVTEPDGSERAVEIHVFPEDMRGSGEGSYKWDLPVAGAGLSRMTNGTAASRMTNGTVAGSTMTNGTVAVQAPGSVVTLQYKDGASSGSRAITIPPGIPIVAIESGNAADLQPGAHVFVVAHRSGRSLTADRVLAGKGGVVPPM